MRTSPTTPPSLVPAGTRVLICDDDQGIRRMAAAALERAGFVVAIAEDVQPAILMSAALQPDLALVDLNMSSSGLEVVRHLKRLYGDAVWVTVFSGEEGDDVRGDCFAAGADDVIAKPAPSSELRRRMIAAANAQRTFVRR